MFGYEEKRIASIDAGHSKLRLITLVGPGYIRRPYVQRCVYSWRRIQGAETVPIAVNAGMSENDQSRARELGLEVSDEYEAIVHAAVENRPTLRELRNRFLTWKKVVDPVVLGRGARTLIIDTDVFITQRVMIPGDCPPFVYQCDDVPAYRGSWKLPLLEPMVYSLNAGFLLIEPDDVDLDHMEHIAKRYFLTYPIGWWTAQSMWSTIMARSGNVGIFSGEDVCTFSGSRKRTMREARANRVKLFGNGKLISERTEALRMIRGLAVVHFAGRGKAWIDLVNEVEGISRDQRELRVHTAQPASALQCVLLSSRMLAVRLKDRFRVA